MSYTYYRSPAPRGKFLSWLERLSIINPRPPEPPHRTTKCAICGEEFQTTKMEGELAHVLCMAGMSAFCKAKQKREQEKELIKEALRELELERQSK